MEKTWSVMKEIIGKVHQHNKSKILRKLFVDRRYTTLETEIAKMFHEFFTEIGPSLTRTTPDPSKPFESFLKRASTTYHTINALTDAFFSLKINKSIDADEISFSVIKNCFEELIDILRHVFDLPLQPGIFPDPLKFTKETPVFKTGKR